VRGGCAQREETTRRWKTDGRLTWSDVDGTPRRRAGRRHTTSCLSRRRRPLALRPPSAALSLPSSSMTAWYARNSMSFAMISQISQVASSAVCRLAPPSTSSVLACPSSASIRASLPCSRMGGANSLHLVVSSPSTFFHPSVLPGLQPGPPARAACPDCALRTTCAQLSTIPTQHLLPVVSLCFRRTCTRPHTRVSTRGRARTSKPRQRSTSERRFLNKPICAGRRPIRGGAR
jgi:hypothetical protein